MTVRTSLSAVACALALVAAASVAQAFAYRDAAHALTVLSQPPATSASAAPTRACGAEDDATWDWTRCGNRQRGVAFLPNMPTPRCAPSADGRAVAQTPCHKRIGKRRVVIVTAFAFCAYDGAVDWRATAHLRGDRRAMRTCVRQPRLG